MGAGASAGASTSVPTSKEEALAAGFTEDQIDAFLADLEEYKKVCTDYFNALDHDHNGELDMDEVKILFTVSGCPPPMVDMMASQAMQMADTNHDGVLSLEEFVTQFSNTTIASGGSISDASAQMRGEVEKVLTLNAQGGADAMISLDHYRHAVGDYFHNDHGTGFHNVLAEDAKALLNAIGRPDEVVAKVDEARETKEGGMLSFEDFVQLLTSSRPDDHPEEEELAQLKATCVELKAMHKKEDAEKPVEEEIDVRKMSEEQVEEEGTPVMFSI